MATVLIAFAAVLLLSLAVIASVVVVRAGNGLAKHQVIAQIALTWLVPLAGPVLVLLVHRSDASPRSSPDRSGPSDDLPLGGAGGDGA